MLEVEKSSNHAQVVAVVRSWQLFTRLSSLMLLLSVESSKMAFGGVVVWLLTAWGEHLCAVLKSSFNLLRKLCVKIVKQTVAVQTSGGRENVWENFPNFSCCLSNEFGKFFQQLRALIPNCGLMCLYGEWLAELRVEKIGCFVNIHKFLVAFHDCESWQVMSKVIKFRTRRQLWKERKKIKISLKILKNQIVSSNWVKLNLCSSPRPSEEMENFIEFPSKLFIFFFAALLFFFISNFLADNSSSSQLKIRLYNIQWRCCVVLWKIEKKNAFRKLNEVENIFSRSTLPPSPFLYKLKMTFFVLCDFVCGSSLRILETYSFFNLITIFLFHSISLPHTTTL